MSQTLRAALITEPTAWHRRSMIDALSNAEIGDVAVGDPTGGTFDEVKKGIGDKVKATYTDLGQLFQEFRPEVALVTMEPWRMPAPILQALQSGAHVFHEKPGYVNIDDYRAIYRLARQRQRQLGIAYVSRHYPIVQEARRIIADGLLGELFAFQAWFVADQERVQQRPAKRFEYDHAAGGWFFNREKAGGGHLTILGCHYLDLLRHLSGANFRQVAAVCRNVGGEPVTVEDAACLTIQMDSGIVGNLNSGFYTSSAEYGSTRHNGIHFWGRDGWLKLNPGGDATREPLLWMSHRGVQSAAPLKSWVFDGAGASADLYRMLARDFFRACLGQGPAPVRPEDGMWVNECIAAAYRASDTGQTQTVTIPAV
ncbi:MAG: Gfo/Idh/MocA family oxidoreductase [Actinobacteria bacterium]|nr:Gfo/Idh/MocA family oxidoreductase [Actinomycetota bacterium]